MPKKKRFRPRFSGSSDGFDGGGGGGGGPANGSASRPRPKRPRGNGGPRRNYAGPRPATGGTAVDDAPLEGEEEIIKEFVGLLEMHPNGYGFLRSPGNNYSRERTDPFVPGTMIEKFQLRPGVMVRAQSIHTRRQQGPRIKEILDIEGMSPEDYLNVKSFDTLTAVNPEQWLQLEVGQQPLTNRIIDLLAPLGRGQRALIVAPPRSGKTIMLQHISTGIATNFPDVKLIVMLIDERPEEVTDMRRNVINGEVIASSLDEDVDSHVRISQLVIERCKRLAECGKDVFLLMDSITRLARAFNKWVGSGPTMSGGVNIKAMDIPKKLFASARAFAEGGSLTIVGTALVDTGSRMDELIFQEFKGTGNMELVLDRKLADRRVWPAIDISQSGTRREELLHDPETLHAVTMIRRTLNTMNPVEAMEQLTTQLGKFKTNKEFLKLIASARILD